MRGFKQFCAILLSFTLLTALTPAQVSALSISGVMISEIQTTDDVIELTNTSDSSVTISGWRIQTKSTSSTSNWITRFTFPEATTLYPGGFILVTKSGYLSDKTSFHLSFDMAADKGHVRFIDDSEVPVEHDKIGWAVDVLDPETSPAPKPTLGLTLQRRSADDLFIDTDDNSSDFILAAPSFSSENRQPPVEEEPTDPPEDETPPDVDDNETPPPDDDTPPPDDNEETTPPTETIENPEPETLDPEVIYKSPIINEILPDPAPPLTDADSEWIELYNPFEERLELRGYVIKSGSSGSYSHVFTDEFIEPLSYVVVTSSETSLLLSNSSGAVRVYSPTGPLLSEMTYGETKEGWSYMKDSAGTWAWTTSPTPSGVNILTVPTAAQTVVKAASSSKAAKTSAPKTSSAKKATTTTKKASMTKKSPAQTERNVFEEPAAVPVDPPLHPLILAGGALLAVLYGGYEYRNELRNYLYRFKSYRTSRK